MNINGLLIGGGTRLNGGRRIGQRQAVVDLGVRDAADGQLPFGYGKRSVEGGDLIVGGHVLVALIPYRDSKDVFRLSCIGDDSRDLNFGRLSLGHRACFDRRRILGQRQAVIDLGVGGAADGQLSLGYRERSDKVGDLIVAGHVVARLVGDLYDEEVFRLSRVGDDTRDQDLGKLSLGDRAGLNGCSPVGQGRAVVDLGVGCALHGQLSLGYREGSVDGGQIVVGGDVGALAVGDQHRKDVLCLPDVRDASRDPYLGGLPLGNRAGLNGRAFVGQGQTVVDFGVRAAEQGQASLEHRQLAKAGGDGVVVGNIPTVCIVDRHGEAVGGGARFGLLSRYHDDRRLALGYRADEDVGLMICQDRSVVDLAGGCAAYGDGALGYGQGAVDQGGLIIGRYVVLALIQNADREGVFRGACAGLRAREGGDHGVSLGQRSAGEGGRMIRKGKSVVFLGGRGADHGEAPGGYGQRSVDDLNDVVGGGVGAVRGLDTEHGGVLGHAALGAGACEVGVHGLTGDGGAADRLPRAAYKGRAVIFLDRRIRLHRKVDAMHLQAAKGAGQIVMLGHVIAVGVVDRGDESVFLLTCVLQGGGVADAEAMPCCQTALCHGHAGSGEGGAVIHLFRRGRKQGDVPSQHRQEGAVTGDGVVGADILSHGIQNGHGGGAGGLSGGCEATRQGDLGRMALGQGSVGHLPLGSRERSAVVYLLGIFGADLNGSGGDGQLSHLILDPIVLGNVSTLLVRNGNGYMVVGGAHLGLGAAHLNVGRMALLQSAAGQLPVYGGKGGSVIDLVCGGGAEHQLGGGGIQRSRSHHDQHDDQQRHDPYDGRAHYVYQFSRHNLNL